MAFLEVLEGAKVWTVFLEEEFVDVEFAVTVDIVDAGEDKDFEDTFLEEAVGVSVVGRTTSFTALLTFLQTLAAS